MPVEPIDVATFDLLLAMEGYVEGLHARGFKVLQLRVSPRHFMLLKRAAGLYGWSGLSFRDIPVRRKSYAKNR